MKRLLRGTGDRQCGVVVVGAGPYGLSSAAHLRAHGVDVVMIGRTMASWREGMPAGMQLKSSPNASSISAPSPDGTLVDFLASIGRPPYAPGYRVPLSQFIDYGAWFEQRFVADVHDDSTLERLNRNGSGFVLEMDTGARLRADAIVVAAGHRPHAYIPQPLADLAARGLVSHTSDHRELCAFAGQKVAVVGAGQSGLETAALLSEVGAEAVLVARRPELQWDLTPRRTTVFGEWRRPTSGIGPGWPKRMLERHAGMVRHLPHATRMMLLREVLGPSGAYWLRDRFEQESVSLFLASHVRAAEEHRGRVRLRIETNGATSTIDVDRVIAATGYRFDVDRIGFLDENVRGQVDRRDGFPRLSRNFESSVPGLYFVGLAAGATFGPLLRFVCGTQFVSPRLAAAVAQKMRGRSAEVRA
jgi:cation diffusion facilitator CzcD-associated flavoprotein CzcO